MAEWRAPSGCAQWQLAQPQRVLLRCQRHNYAVEHCRAASLPVREKQSPNPLFAFRHIEHEIVSNFIVQSYSRQKSLDGSLHPWDSCNLQFRASGQVGSYPDFGQLANSR
jgi:hypothetical protein